MNELESAALVLKEAFEGYVATIGQSSGDPRLVVRALNDLHAAVRLFTDASVRTSGWGNPFILPAEEGEEDGGEAVGVVQVEARYKLQVTDPYTFGGFVLERARKAGRIPGESVDVPVAQIHELFAIDGWDPHRYRRPDLKVLQARWSVSPDRS
jgi:hypothetical protein